MARLICECGGQLALGRQPRLGRDAAVEDERGHRIAQRGVDRSALGTQVRQQGGERSAADTGARKPCRHVCHAIGLVDQPLSGHWPGKSLRVHRLRWLTWPGTSIRDALRSSTLACCCTGFGAGLQVRAGLGLDPWDVFHQGIARHVGLAIGTVLIIVGALVLLLWIPLRQRPGLGTVSNVVLIGVSLNLSLQLVPNIHGWPGASPCSPSASCSAGSRPACTSARTTGRARVTD